VFVSLNVAVLLNASLPPVSVINTGQQTMLISWTLLNVGVNKQA